MDELAEKRERVGKLEGTSRCRLCASTGFRVNGGEDVFIKLVTSKLGRRGEGRSEDINEMDPFRRRERTRRACYGIKTHLKVNIGECGQSWTHTDCVP